jgi:hypothetical protein
MNPDSNRRVSRHGLQAKCILARWNQSQWHRGAIAASVHVLGFEPRTKAWIVDFRMALPKIRGQSTLDPKVIQLQFDGRDIFGEISPNIIRSDVQSGKASPFALRFNYHIHLLFNVGYRVQV